MLWESLNANKPSDCHATRLRCSKRQTDRGPLVQNGDSWWSGHYLLDGVSTPVRRRENGAVDYFSIVKYRDLVLIRCSFRQITLIYMSAQGKFLCSFQHWAHFILLLSISAVDCLRTLVSEMTRYVLSGTKRFEREIVHLKYFKSFFRYFSAYKSKIKHLAIIA